MPQPIGGPDALQICGIIVTVQAEPCEDRSGQAGSASATLEQVLPAVVTVRKQKA